MIAEMETARKRKPSLSEKIIHIGKEQDQSISDMTLSKTWENLQETVWKNPDSKYVDAAKILRSSRKKYIVGFRASAAMALYLDLGNFHAVRGKYLVHGDDGTFPYPRHLGFDIELGERLPQHFGVPLRFFVDNPVLPVGIGVEDAVYGNRVGFFLPLEYALHERLFLRVVGDAASRNGLRRHRGELDDLAARVQGGLGGLDGGRRALDGRSGLNRRHSLSGRNGRRHREDSHSRPLVRHARFFFFHPGLSARPQARQRRQLGQIDPYEGLKFAPHIIMFVCMVLR